MKTADILTGPAEPVLDLPLAKRKFIQSPTQGDRSAPYTSAVDVPSQLRCGETVGPEEQGLAQN